MSLASLLVDTVPVTTDLVGLAAVALMGVTSDVRRGSPSPGQWVGSIVDDVDHPQLWMPPGFAHGFLLLSEVAAFCYLCSVYFDQLSEQGIAWDDAAIGIEWPELPEGVETQLSSKDLSNPTLANQAQERLPQV